MFSNILFKVHNNRCLVYIDVYKRQVLYTPPVTPWELVTPEVSDPTVRRELPKVGPITGVKS